MAATRKSGADAAADAPSQAQSASAEPAQVEQNQPETKAAEGSPEGTGADADIQFFDCTIVKIDRDGNEVMSDHLEAGEQLRRATTDRYSTVRPETGRGEQHRGESAESDG